jgi:YVTN family beta-propeller protein
MKIRNAILSAVTLLLAHSSFIFGLPIITNIYPTSGSIAGGTAITITGSGFTGATAVNFDSTPAAAFLILNDNSVTAVSPPGTPGLVNISITAPSGTSSNSLATRYVYTGDWFAYGTNTATGSVSTINTRNDTVFTFAVGSNPNNIAFSPDGKKAYVTDSVEFGVHVIDVATNTIDTFILLSGAPTAIAIAPDGKTAYVVGFTTTDFMPIDLTTNTALLPFQVAESFDLAIAPDGKTAYVAGFFANEIIPVNLATQALGTAIPINMPIGITITPDGATAFATNFSNNLVLPINLASNLPETTIPVGNNPYGINVAPDNKNVYVANSLSNSVSGINTITRIIDNSYLVGNTPILLAITPDSKLGYVSNSGSGDVSKIDFATSVVTALPTSTGPAGIAITPDQAPIASFVTGLGRAGTPSIFDASSSISPVGTIVKYDWNFGDGVTLSTTSPSVSHTYAVGGSYIVTLTVTNSAGTSTTVIFTSHMVTNNGGPNASVTQTFVIAPVNPLFEGRAIRNRFLNDTEYVNELVWTTRDTSIVSFKLYRNGKLLETFPNGSFKYIDHDLKKNKEYVYTLVGISNIGLETDSMTIVIP